MDANKLENIISGHSINADDAAWLRSLAPPAAVPANYALVPVEPTQRMITAARKHHKGDHYLPVSLWRAMLAAAERKENNNE